MGCCGQKSGAKLAYEVHPRNGPVQTVGTVAEAKIVLAQGGGGTYRAVTKAK